MDKKDKWKKVRSALGLDTRDAYSRAYILESNLRAGIYMTLITLALEIWMILSLTRYVIEKAMAGSPRTGWWLFTHYGRYLVVVEAAVLLLIYAVLYFRKRKLNPLLGQLLIWNYALTGLIFGMYIGYNDFLDGKQILSFVTMVILSLCMLVWRPLLLLLLSGGTFVIFYAMISRGAAAAGLEITYADQVNLFTMWISVFIVGLSLHHQRVSEAEKDEALEKANRSLQHLVEYDGLTGIHNLYSFNKEAGEFIQKQISEKKKTDLLYFDIENFKSYNDKLGFDEGNQLLKRFGTELVGQFGQYPTARISDDHFAAATPREKSEEFSRSMARYLEQNETSEVPIQLKIGSCCVEDDTLDVNAGLDRARIAAGMLKKQYDQCFREYDPGLHDKVQRKNYVINHIDEAVREGYIRVFYQPVMSTATGCLCGLEALARWDDPELGLLPPFQFVETLEEYRQIHKLDQQIIELVCRDFSRCEGEPLYDIPVSLNFSQLDFELYDVPEFLNKMAEKYGVPHDRLDVEITESALNGDTKALHGYMDRLRSAGYALWLDDFGSGYSSLNVLKDFHFDVLKIDMVFLRGFGENPNVNLLIRSIVEMAKQLGMVTLTEGVETGEMFEFLRSVGCDKAQGYHFSKPVPREELEALIASGKIPLPKRA